MESNSSRQAHDSSSSAPTVESVRCDAILELGKRLTVELGFDKSPSTLGQWMAHYVAELIDGAEKASRDERPAKMQACCDAILKLWKHRYWWPSGKRPFEHLEPLMELLAKLDPEDGPPRYYSVARGADSEENGDAKRWLSFVESVDDSAKMLIRFGLVQAVQAGLPKSSEWARLAEAAGEKEEVEFVVTRMLSNEKRILDDSDLSEAEKKRVEARAERLERFAERATALASVLRRENQGDEGNDADEGEQPDPEIPEDPEVDDSMSQQS